MTIAKMSLLRCPGISPRKRRTHGLMLLWSMLMAGTLMADKKDQPPVVAATTSSPATNATATAPSPGARRTFTWQDLSLPEYSDYLKTLRAAGCPENRLRELVIGDVNELFDQKRLQEAVELDFQWWRSNNTSRVAVEAEADQQLSLETQRVELLARHLSTEQTNRIKLLPLVSGIRHGLTGPLLGAFPLEKHLRVIEISREFPRKQKAYGLACRAEGRAPDPVEEIKMREEMRSQLRQVMTPQEMEEYLVRTSATATALRKDLRALETNPEEFRKIFGALDPIKVRMQLEYGNEKALSVRQREEFQKDCDQVVQEILPPERFKLYLLSRDPNYQQALNMAAAYKFDEKATWRLFEGYRDQAARRDKIMADTSLAPEERELKLRSIAQDAQTLLTDLITAQQAQKQIP